MINTLESVAIRRGGPADTDALQLLVRGHISLERLDWPWLLGSAEHFVYVAEDDNIFGFVAAGRPLDPLPGYEDVGEIAGVCLNSGYQRHGMGTKLLVRGISVLKRRGFATAFAWLPDDAPWVGRVFGSVGFAASGVTRVTNVATGELRESGFGLDLAAFF